MRVRTLATGVVMTAPVREDPDDLSSDVTFVLGTRQSLVYRGQTLGDVDCVETCWVTCNENTPEGKDLAAAVLKHVQNGNRVVVEGDMSISRAIAGELDDHTEDHY